MKSIVLISIVLFYNYANSQNKNILKNVFSTNGEIHKSWYKIDDIVIDPNNNTYVLDSFMGSIIKLNKQGEIVKRQGKLKSNGGEYASPKKLTIFNDVLLVLDPSIKTVHFLNFNLDYINKIILDGYPRDIAATKAKYFVAFYTHDKDRLICSISKNGEIKYFNNMLVDKSDILNSVSIALKPSGNLIVAYRYFNKILEYTQNGELVDSLSIPDYPKKSVVNTIAKINYEVPDKLMLNDVAIDKSGLIYILGGEYSSNPQRDIFVINNNSIINHLILPEESGVIAINESKEIFVRENKRKTLSKYQVLLKKGAR